MNKIDLIKTLTLANAASGFETPVARIFEAEIGDEEQYLKDNLGSIAIEKNGADSPRILFVAHMDEVGFIVQDVLENGLIKIYPLGGWNPASLISSPVTILNSYDEEISGVIASVPVHFLKNRKSQYQEIADMFVDVGAVTKKEIDEVFRIRIGDAITPKSIYSYNERTNRMISKAFDDRIGVAAVIETAKMVKSLDHENTVICGASVQEEVGTRGASTIAELTKPDIAIILEGAPADDFPGKPGNSQTKLGGGAHMRIFDPSMIAKYELRNFVMKIAEENNVRIQPTVRTGGGTDGKVISLKQKGIPSIVLGCPVRYAHSHNGIVDLSDFDELMKLIKVLITNLNNEAFKRILA